MDLGNLLAGFGAAFFIWLALTAGVMLFGLWLTYTIIWRAVRRGLREYQIEEDRLARAAAAPPRPPKVPRAKPGRTSWSLHGSQPLRPEPGPRDW